MSQFSYLPLEVTSIKCDCKNPRHSEIGCVIEVPEPSSNKGPTYCDWCFKGCFQRGET